MTAAEAKQTSIASSNAKPNETLAFTDMHASMTQGWGGTLDQLAAFLAKA